MGILDAFSIDPQAWGSGGQGPGGSATPPRIRPITERYTGSIDPEYLARARQVFYQAPAINSGSPDQPRMTPADWLRNEIASDYAQRSNIRLTPEQVDAIATAVFNHQVGMTPGHPMTVDYSRRLLRRLKGESPVGEAETKAFDGQTLAEREARRRDPYQDGRFMTSPGLETQLDALRAYTMLGALEEDPELQLPMFNSSGNLQSAIGTMFFGSPYNFEKGEFNWGNANADPISDPGVGIRYLTKLRNYHSVDNPVDARQQEALYWDRLGEQARAQEGQYKSSLAGAYYWPWSFMHDSGMARNTEYNQANLLTSIDKKMNRTLSEPNMWMGDEGRRLHHLGDQLNRDVVIVPESGTPEETQEAQKRFRQLADETEQRQIDEYPLYQEAYNNLMPGTALDVKEYSFPSPAWNSLANAPKYSVDLTTLASLGAAAPGSIAAATAKSAAARAGMQAGKNTIRKLAKTAYHSVPAYLATDYAIDLGTDQLTEQPYAMMLHSAQNDGEQPNWAAPMQRSNVSDDPGKPGDGGQYRKEFDQFKRKQSDNVRWLLDYQNRHHPIKLSPIGLE